MARRPDPRQPSLFDLLPAGPEVHLGVDPVWASRLVGYIVEGLPAGATIPFTDILAIRPDRPWLDGKVYRVLAHVRLWDGVEHELSVRICGTCREINLYFLPGTQPPGRQHYEIFYPAVRWDGRRWLRGEPSADWRGAHWEVDLAEPDRVRRRRPAFA
ncbi:hypothetical protein [Methylobacterium sp. SD21]|uniref:hypothetical protein n=1 Tax=Methylobacterium litchii TaxID=3138810 RepID=UPI00313D75D7